MLQECRNHDLKYSIIERVQRTSDKLDKYLLYKNTQRYIFVLQKFVEA